MGPVAPCHLSTTDPTRSIVLELGPESVGVKEAESSAAADLVLPMESLVRLVNGRLDPDHTPPGIDSPLLDQLRVVFPGF